jgi:hypothetical protein
MALDDFIKSVRSQYFKADMGVFLQSAAKYYDVPLDPKVCVGCMAGARLFQAGHRNDDEPVWGANMKKLFAIDSLRVGDLYGAAYDYGVTTKVEDRHIPPYKRDRRGFYKGIRKLIADLREAGE